VRLLHRRLEDNRHVARVRVQSPPRLPLLHDRREGVDLEHVASGVHRQRRRVVVSDIKRRRQPVPPDRVAVHVVQLAGHVRDLLVLLQREPLHHVSRGHDLPLPEVQGVELRQRGSRVVGEQVEPEPLLLVEPRPGVQRDHAHVVIVRDHLLSDAPVVAHVVFRPARGGGGDRGRGSGGRGGLLRRLARGLAQRRVGGRRLRHGLGGRRHGRRGGGRDHRGQVPGEVGEVVADAAEVGAVVALGQDELPHRVRAEPVGQDEAQVVGVLRLPGEGARVHVPPLVHDGRRHRVQRHVVRVLVQVAAAGDRVARVVVVLVRQLHAPPRVEEALRLAVAPGHAEEALLVVAADASLLVHLARQVDLDRLLDLVPAAATTHTADVVRDLVHKTVQVPVGVAQPTHAQVAGQRIDLLVTVLRVVGAGAVCGVAVVPVDVVEAAGAAVFVRLLQVAVLVPAGRRIVQVRARKIQVGVKVRVVVAGRDASNRIRDHDPARRAVDVHLYLGVRAVFVQRNHLAGRLELRAPSVGWVGEIVLGAHLPQARARAAAAIRQSPVRQRPHKDAQNLLALDHVVLGECL